MFSLCVNHSIYVDWFFNRFRYSNQSRVTVISKAYFPFLQRYSRLFYSNCCLHKGVGGEMNQECHVSFFKMNQA